MTDRRSRPRWAAVLIPLLAAVSILGASCASTTHISSTWVKPNLGPLNFRKVVTMAFSRTPERRRMMEDTMASEIQRTVPDVQAIPSYTLVPDKDVQDESRVRDQINKGGFDGAIAMRVTNVEASDVYVPGRTEYAPVHYRTFWGYYHYWAPIAYEPGYVERDRSVQVETEVYSTAGDTELVYSAVSDTLNPNSPSDLAKSVAGKVTHDLKDKGLLREKTGQER